MSIISSSPTSKRLPAAFGAGLALAVLGACGDGGSGSTSTTPWVPASTPIPSPTPTPTLSPTPTPTGLVRVSGNRLLRDGVPWVPHAVQLVAFVAPPAYQAGVFLDAYRHYSVAEFCAIRDWGADSVRMQLSQPGALPNGPKHDEDFVRKYVEGVKAARAAGLTVIVSIQDEVQSGEEHPIELPNGDTIAVWQDLVKRLKSDDGVVYELFNEPQPMPDAAGWARWRDKMGDVVAAIRAAGATNVLLADGLNFAETLDGLVPLDDPLGQMAYSSHPYFHNEVDQQEAAWTRKFGAAAARFPVIVGEWTSVANTPDTYYCAATTPEAAHGLLKYIAARNIGLVAVTYDFGLPRYGGIVSDYDGTPTTFAGGRQCGDVGFGPGTLVRRWYRTGVVPAALE